MTIFFLVKVFDEEQHAEDFVRGKLYSNRLSYFRKLEESEAANRGDRYEGVVDWHQPSEIEIVINGRTLTDLAGPVSVQMNWHDHINVFCVYAAHSGSFESLTHENLADFKRQLEISEDCQKLGGHAVLVTNVTQFFERVRSAARENNYGLSSGLVEYYNPETFSGSFSENEAIFKKRDEFQHQKEYRFAIDTGVEGDKPITLEIGDISDITSRCNVMDINNSLEIKLP
ncbi:hypothetical protein RBU55_30235 [Pseudomonas chlororaphis subsp. aurantiaca]|uniref:hypothetical protein n=1 Tax=Pseudomonas chlororaphis TaxID=587753 RepID=UPI0027DCF00B|nr:hypothetical protein [Pseudomonas chlororaphis]WMI99762.1 hypothetical protein RBU55_30235 [Pseudomonas chlororaphis subsp. aurantiaca]